MPDHSPEPQICNRANAAHYLWGQQCEGWRLLDRLDLSVIQERMPPNTFEERHYHQRSRQLFFVLQGCLTMEVGGVSYELGVGDSLEVAPQSPHQVRNVSPAEAHFLVISSPSTQGDRLNLNHVKPEG